MIRQVKLQMLVVNSYAEHGGGFAFMRQPMKILDALLAANGIFTRVKD